MFFQQKIEVTFSKNKPRIPKLKSYMVPNTWNSLPNDLKSATSVNSFNHYIEEYFFKS